MAGPLDGRCILVVEDEAAVSLMIAHLAVEAGATVIGPIADAATALTLVETEAVDCAVLDYKLIDGTSLPVADALLERGVPFLFASAYDLAAIAPGLPGCLAWRRSMRRSACCRRSWRFASERSCHDD